MIKCKQNYIGKKFNHLTVIEQVDDFVSQSNNRHRPQFLCQCDCKKDNPKTIVVRLDSLKSGHTASCGCVKLKHTLELYRGLQRNNSSGCKGVGFHRASNKWRARIKVNKKEIILGLFDKKDDAVMVRLVAEKKYFDRRSWQTELMTRYNLLNGD